MKAHIIQLVHHDDVVSIKDKISWSKAPRVLLVWPKRGRFILRQADLVLLQRHALTLGCQVGLVTKNPEMVAVARVRSLFRPKINPASMVAQATYTMVSYELLQGAYPDIYQRIAMP